MIANANDVNEAKKKVVGSREVVVISSIIYFSLFLCSIDRPRFHNAVIRASFFIHLIRALDE